MAGFAEYSSYDALGLAELVRKKEVSAAELVEECIARIERVNSRINAVVHTMYPQARAAAEADLGDGAFAGVPFLVKDLTQRIPGVPTSNGSRMYRGWIPEGITELYRRYQAAGLVTVGKTNTPELGLNPFTEPELWGACRNPWNTARTPGGSSGGAGASVAAGIVPMAHGGDGGGSIRIPSSCCGIFGLKPTRARTPHGPFGSEGWNGFAQDHVLSRSVRDSAAALDATHGPEPTSIYYAPPVEGPYLGEVTREPGQLRIGFHAEPGLPGTVHPDCVAAVEDAARLCEQLGHRVERVKPGHDPMTLGKAFFTVVAANASADVVHAERELGRRSSARDWETETWLLYLIGKQVTAAEVALALRELQAETRRLRTLFADYDVILTPTLGDPPIEVGALRARGAEAALQEVVAHGNLAVALKLPGLIEQTVARVYDFIPFTPVANFTGQPSMSVPLHWNDQGLPIGSMFTGRFGDEATLFRLAGQLEQARPWWDRRAQVFADAT